MATRKTAAKAAPKKSVAPVTVIKLVPQEKPVAFRGARAAWYEELQNWDGKPLADFTQHCVDNPPSLPKSGKAEKPSGWVSFFVRQQLLELVTK